MNQQRASVYIYRSLVVFGALLFSSIAQGASFQLSLQPIQVCDDSGMICSNLPYSETAQNDIWHRLI